MSTDRTSAIPATASALHRLASGDFANNPHPLHPYLAHFPAAFFVAAFTSDFWLKWIGNAAIGGVGLGQLSGALHAIAVGAAVPAALTGAAEYFNILSDPGRNTALTHALLNVSALAISLYNLTARARFTGFNHTGWTGEASTLGLFGTLYSIYLGGTLVYERGIGVKRQGSGASPGTKEFVGKRGAEVGEKIARAAG